MFVRMTRDIVVCCLFLFSTDVYATQYAEPTTGPKTSIFGPRYLSGEGNKFHDGIDYRAAAGTALRSNVIGNIVAIYPFNHAPTTTGNRIQIAPKGDANHGRFLFAHLFAASSTTFPIVSGNFALDYYEFHRSVSAGGLRISVNHPFVCTVIFVADGASSKALIDSTCKAKGPIEQIIVHNNFPGIRFRVANQVNVGDIIAATGNSGGSGSLVPHLHLGYIVDTKRNPLQVLNYPEHGSPYTASLHPKDTFTQTELSALNPRAMGVKIAINGFDLDEVTIKVSGGSLTNPIMQSFSYGGRVGTSPAATLSGEPQPGLILDTEGCTAKTLADMADAVYGTPQVCPRGWGSSTTVDKPSAMFFVPLGLGTLSPGTYSVAVECTRADGSDCSPNEPLDLKIESKCNSQPGCLCPGVTRSLQDVFPYNLSNVSWTDTSNPLLKYLTVGIYFPTGQTPPIVVSGGTCGDGYWSAGGLIPVTGCTATYFGADPDPINTSHAGGMTLTLNATYAETSVRIPYFHVGGAVLPANCNGVAVPFWQCIQRIVRVSGAYSIPVCR
ncbi:MAG: hypothetical protein NFCOHLIN_01084 [Gammaproteobacteria bacterium]|nr:hypothetical protein [Gammaproteobacteria bacterium]